MQFFLPSLFVFCILKYIGAQLSTDAVYSILSAKIDGLHGEMTLLRQVLMSTMSELTATKSELTSTQKKLMLLQAEVDTIKPALELGTGITTKAMSISSKTENSTSKPYEDKTCCQIVKKAIMNMKAVQHQANQDIENVIENKVAAASDNIERNTKGLVLMETEIDTLVTDFNGYKNVSEKKFANMRQHTNILADVMKDVTLKFLVFTFEQLKLERNLANVSWNLKELSRKHDKLAENVETQKSQMSELVKSEMEMAEHCQSGRVVNWDHNKPHPATYTIKFKTPFRNIPVLTLGASSFDFSNGANLRLIYVLKEVSKTRAEVHVDIWATTVAYGYGFHWMACPT